MSTTLSELSGLELMQAMADGEVPPPPFANHLQVSLDHVEEGRTVFSATPRPEYLNPMGQVHGGVISTLLDSAMGCAVHSTLPAGAGYTTVELGVNFVRAVPLDAERIIADARVLHVGGRIATAEGKLTTDDGTLLAHATTTCMLFR